MNKDENLLKEVRRELLTMEAEGLVYRWTDEKGIVWWDLTPKGIEDARGRGIDVPDRSIH